MELGKRKIFEMEKNCQKIYDIIVTSGKVTTKFIKEYLDDRTDVHNRIIEREAEAEGERRYNHGDFTSIDRENFIKKSINEKRKYTISVRTIQRCLQNDSRIIKKGKYYTVDEETRFETRYRNPQRFGYFISDEVIYNKGYGYDKTAMEKMINIFGAITLFVFIEAAKPFKDKFNFENKKNGFLDRRDYIKYWALNAIPLKSMFEAFTLVFTNEVQRKKVEQVKNKNTSKALDKPDDRPHNEMTDKQSQDCLNMLENIYPEIYKELLSARNKFMGELKSG